MSTLLSVSSPNIVRRNSGEYYGASKFSKGLANKAKPGRQCNKSGEIFVFRREAKTHAQIAAASGFGKIVSMLKGHRNAAPMFGFSIKAGVFPFSVKLLLRGHLAGWGSKRRCSNGRKFKKDASMQRGDAPRGFGARAAQ